MAGATTARAAAHQVRSRPDLGLRGGAGDAPVLRRLPLSLRFPSPRPGVALHRVMRSRDALTATVAKAAAANTPAPPAAERFANTTPSAEALKIWRSADAVCFDVDSTVCLDEGIDELADFCGAGQAVAEWTARAMNGSVTFEEALAARLSLFNPSLAQVQACLEKRPPRISPGMADLINKLRARKTDVYLISGGFRQMINPVAKVLGVRPENIFANQLLFGTSGEFLGFDRDEPTSRSGGKATAVRKIRKEHGYNTMIMIGDGATDLEARQPGGADLFICYGGVQLRESVAKNADWLVLQFDDLLTCLD